MIKLGEELDEKYERILLLISFENLIHYIQGLNVYKRLISITIQIDYAINKAILS